MTENNKTKHTPGPWDKILPLGAVIKNGVKFPRPVNEERREGESWLEMRDRTQPERDKNDQEEMANQRLQKMAPEMLEMLEYFKIDIERGQDISEHYSDIVDLIDKAKG